MRTIILLAAAMLAAAPAAAQQQSAAAQNDPTVEIDPCTGKPVVIRPDDEAAAETPVAHTHATAGVQAHGGHTPTGAHTGTAHASSTPHVGTSQPASGAAHGTAASATSGAGQTMTSSTAASGSAISPTGTPGAAASATSATGQTMTSSTSSIAADDRPTDPRAAASGTSGAGQTMASSTAANGSAISPSANPGAAASAASGAGQTMTSSTSSIAADDRPTDPRAAARNRAALRLGLGPAGDRVRLGPAASVSVPTALGVDAGEMFFGVAYQGRTRYTEEDDGAAVVGIGIGSRRVVALEAAVTTYSTFRGAPFETGGVSFKLHRALPGQTSVAVGWENAVLWGGSDDDGSLYAVASRLVNLRDHPSAPFSTGVVTLGVGNGRFRFEEDDAEGRETVNVFGAAGVRVIAPLSLVADWTGQDLNAAASITPAPRLPLVVTVGLADITGSAGDGARLILSLGYGLAFPQPF